MMNQFIYTSWYPPHFNIRRCCCITVIQQELLTLSWHLSLPYFQCGSFCSSFSFQCSVLQMIVLHFVLFRLAIAFLCLPKKVLCLLRFLLFFFFLSFFLPSVKSLSDTFLGDALIKLYETLQEYHMPCEVVPLRVDFSKIAVVLMETAKMLKKMKNTKMIIAGYSPNRN